MSIFWTLISAISSVAGNFVTRCPKCSAKMNRVEMHEQAYMKKKQSRSSQTARPTSTFNIEVGRRVALQTQVVPVYDVCTQCGHRVRRKNLEIG